MAYEYAIPTRRSTTHAGSCVEGQTTHGEELRSVIELVNREEDASRSHGSANYH